MRELRPLRSLLLGLAGSGCLLLGACGNGGTTTVVETVTESAVVNENTNPAVPAAEDLDAAANKADRLMEDLYGFIVAKDFDAAWLLMGGTIQQELVEPVNWSATYENTESLKLRRISTTARTPDKVTARVTYDWVQFVPSCDDTIEQRWVSAWEVRDTPDGWRAVKNHRELTGGPRYDDASNDCAVEESEPEGPDVLPEGLKKKPVQEDCHPSYEGECLDPASLDYDCPDGEGDGPDYATGPVDVVDYDEFDLDRDGNGTGCE